MQFQIVTAQTVRNLPVREGFAPRRVDWLTLRAADGGQYQVSAFVPATSPLPAPGSWIDGDLGDADPVDSDRRRFRVTTATAPAPVPPTAGPPSPVAGPPASYGTDPARSARIERQHSQEMALRYLTLLNTPDQPADVINLRNVFALTSAFELDLSGPHPPAREVAPTPGGMFDDPGPEPDTPVYTGEDGW